MPDALQVQGLPRGAAVSLWRRRICTFLRLVVGSAVHLRVSAALGERPVGRSGPSWLRLALQFQRQCVFGDDESDGGSDGCEEFFDGDGVAGLRVAV